MAIELPPISAKITGDLSPLRASLATAKSEAKAAATEIKAQTEAVAAAATPAPKVQTEQIQQVQKAVKQAATAMKADIDGAFHGPAVKPRFDAFEQDVRAGMAKAIRAMREQAQSANLSEEVKLRLYGPAQAAKDVAQIEEVAIVAKQAGGEASQGFLRSLNSQLGRGSTAGLLARLITGGGPILAVGLITNALKSATEEAKNLVTQFRSGTIDADEFRVKVVESIPIIGSVGSAIANIHEAITGNQAALKAANEEAAQMEAMSQRIAGYFRDSAEGVKDLQDILGKIQGERQDIGASAFVKQVHAIGRETGQQFDEIHKTASEKIKAIFNPEGGLNHEQLRSQIKGLQAQLATAVAPAPTTGDSTHTVNGQRVKVVTNQDEIDAANAHRTDLQNRLKIAQRDFNAQSGAAKPVQDAAFHDQIEAAKNGGLKYVQLYKDIGSEAAAAFNGALQRTLKRMATPPSPFGFLKQAKQDAAGLAETVKQKFDIVDGRFDLLKKGGETLKSLFPTIAAGVDAVFGGDKKKSKEPREQKDPFDRAKEFPELIRKGSSEALKLQAGATGSAVPQKQLTEAQKHTQLLIQMATKLDFQVVGF
jgi:hypothetical protein